MECKIARSLFTFAGPNRDELATSEQRALVHHLDACPKCKAAFDREQATDATLATAMRDVPIPSDLHSRILARLSAERQQQMRRMVWCASGAGLAAAMLVGVAVWLAFPRPDTSLDVEQILARASQQIAINRDEVVAQYAARGVTMTAPARFNYAYLRSCDVTEFQGQTRVPQLLFVHPEHAGAYARVLVIPNRPLNLLVAQSFAANSDCSVQVLPADDDRFAFVVVYSGAPLEAFLRADTGTAVA